MKLRNNHCKNANKIAKLTFSIAKCKFQHKLSVKYKKGLHTSSAFVLANSNPSVTSLGCRPFQIKNDFNNNFCKYNNTNKICQLFYNIL